ncbi:acyltransferase family protein [Kitasatospora sp. NPDC088783]|uniref:acyltransferase family protein n=1 Tax=Kitasatospora sp. NPDC088783 TaxID=3364077 RepID=UPI00382294B7
MSALSPHRLPGHRGSLAETFSGRANSFGLLRTVLAVAVVVSHLYPLGWGQLEPLGAFSGGQTDLGKTAVVGFFVLSGFMITGSGLRVTIGRFAWHRALRILPGLWMSLAVSALLISPFLYHRLHGTVHGFWSRPDGPLHYLDGAWTTAMSNGWDVSGIFNEGMSRGTNFYPALNGALWSLPFEILCYVVIGLLAAGGVLRRARRFVPLLALALWVVMLNDAWQAANIRRIPLNVQSLVELPLLGRQLIYFVIYLGFAYLLGACARLYQERLPINDSLAVLSALAMVAGMHWGGFFLIGYPAFAYLLFWLAVRLPAFCHKVARKRDYSYGIYVYGFTVEQTMAMLGFARWGHLRFLAVALAVTWVLAALSWHLVESPLLRLKDWAPRLPRRRQPAPPALLPHPAPATTSA